MPLFFGPQFICSSLGDAVHLHVEDRKGMRKYGNRDRSMLTGMMTVWNTQGVRNNVEAVNMEHAHQGDIDNPVPQLTLKLAGCG